jgi:hypothetical protein
VLGIVPRVLITTFLLTLLSFALSLLLGILGVSLAGWLHGHHPDLRLAYRYVALPVAATVGCVTLVVSSVVEVRHYRQAAALARLEQVS